MKNDFYIMIKQPPLHSDYVDLRDASRQIDVHRWSDWPEVNQFLNDIYCSVFKLDEGQLSSILSYSPEFGH